MGERMQTLYGAVIDPLQAAGLLDELANPAPSTKKILLLAADRRIPRLTMT